MPVEDLPESDYRARAERLHQVATELPNPLVAERFEAMATDAIEIAEQKALEHEFRAPELKQRLS
jgi:hypothetical protein